MKNLKSRFAKIRQQIRKGDGTTAEDLLSDLQQDIEEKLEALYKKIETTNKSCCSLSDRYLEVLSAEGNTSRLSVNSCTGRFTLKTSGKSSETVKQEMEKFTKKIMAEELPPVTLRGKVYFSNGLYKWTGVSESKKFKVSFSSEEMKEV